MADTTTATPKKKRKRNPQVEHGLKYTVRNVEVTSKVKARLYKLGFKFDCGEELQAVLLPNGSVAVGNIQVKMHYDEALDYDDAVVIESEEKLDELILKLNSLRKIAGWSNDE